MTSASDILQYDHDFYTLSYHDVRNIAIDEGRHHFDNYGIQEGRFCSSYHLLHGSHPQLAEAFNWRGLKEEPTNPLTPLERTQFFLSTLLCGYPSNLDNNYSNLSRAPTIAKHGKILEWCSKYYNEPMFRVLEIGSRAVCSDSLWKYYLPNCSYVGFDVMEGKNVDVVGDAHRLTDYFEHNSFDLVISFAVFEHLAMPWIVAEEISKILRVGGALAIETHFSFSEHELPWHFFQFNSNGLEVLFNQALGFETIDKGMDNPIIGRFSSSSSDYLRGRLVDNLYCHSSLIAKKVADVYSDPFFNWREALPSILKETMYPSSANGSNSAKQ